jgi:hypothetical protein
MELREAAQILLKTHCPWYCLFKRSYWICPPATESLAGLLSSFRNPPFKTLNIWQDTWAIITSIQGVPPDGWPLALCLEHFLPLKFNSLYDESRQIELFVRYFEFLIYANHPFDILLSDSSSIYQHRLFKYLSNFRLLTARGPGNYINQQWVFPILQYAIGNQDVGHALILDIAKSGRFGFDSASTSLQILFSRFGYSASHDKQTRLLKELNPDKEMYAFRTGILRFEDKWFLHSLQGKRGSMFHVKRQGKNIFVSVFTLVVQYQSFIDCLIHSGAIAEE